MQVPTFARESFHNIATSGHDVLDGLSAAALTWQPGPESNTIAWLMWHLSRVQDDHVAHLAGTEQVWKAGAWAERFGLDPDEDRIGYGDSPEQVVEVRPASTTPLAEYLDAVVAATYAYLDGIDDDAEWDRVVDTSWDPPVTAGVRLSSVINDCLQHVGQAAYLRGLAERTHR